MTAGNFTSHTILQLTSPPQHCRSHRTASNRKAPRPQDAPIHAAPPARHPAKTHSTVGGPTQQLFRHWHHKPVHMNVNTLSQQFLAASLASSTNALIKVHLCRIVCSASAIYLSLLSRTILEHSNKSSTQCTIRPS